MPKSKVSRNKKYRQNHSYGNRVIPATAKWMQVTKIIGIVILSSILLLAIVAMIIKFYNHISTHK